MPPIVDYTDDPEEDSAPQNKAKEPKKEAAAGKKPSSGKSAESKKSAPGGESKPAEKKKPSEPKSSEKKISDAGKSGGKSESRKPEQKKSSDTKQADAKKAAEKKKADEARAAEARRAEEEARRAAEAKAAEKKKADEKKAADKKKADEAKKKEADAKETEKRKARERKEAEKKRAQEIKAEAAARRAEEKEAARAAALREAEEAEHAHAAAAAEPEPEPETDLVDVSIVIPVYNEIKRLPPTLEKVQEFLAANFDTWEIIVSDDGSRDGTVRDLEPKFPKVRFLRAYHNRGKGAAVRRGMLAAKGRRILFSDADLSTPIEELPGMIGRMDAEHCDGVIASRGLPESVLELRQPWWRELAGKAFNQIIRPISGLPYSDTQCGFKLFSRTAARRIFSIVRSEGWAFDVEVLVIGRVLGYSVLEHPVHWINAEGSKIKLSIDAPKMAWDAMRFRWWHFDGRYQPLPEREIRKLEY